MFFRKKKNVGKLIYLPKITCHITFLQNYQHFEFTSTSSDMSRFLNPWKTRDWIENGNYFFSFHHFPQDCFFIISILIPQPYFIFVTFLHRQTRILAQFFPWTQNVHYQNQIASDISPQTPSVTNMKYVSSTTNHHLKKVIVDPERRVPYWIRDWSARSSAFSIKNNNHDRIISWLYYINYCSHSGCGDKNWIFTDWHPHSLNGEKGCEVFLYFVVVYFCENDNMSTNWRRHPLHGEKGCKVGRVGGDDDQSEKPPDAAHYSRWSGLSIIWK